MQGAQKGGKKVWRKKYYPQIKKNTRKKDKKRQEKRDNISAEKPICYLFLFIRFFAYLRLFITSR
jgi:hypothetical protein